MRNTIPALSYVQELETSLAGNIGIAVEGSNATVPGDDAWHPNSGSTLVLPPMDPYGPRTRWIDIFARGTQSCQWSISPQQPYVHATPNAGSTSGPNSNVNGTDTRVYISIDWSQAPPAPSTTSVTINIASSCDWGNYAAPTIQVPIHNTAIPSTFTGFVESDAHISIEASHTSRTTSLNNISYAILPAHGRTLAGITLTPVLAPSQAPAGAGPVLEYSIYSFSSTRLASVTLLLSPSLNFNGDAAGRPLEYGVAFDGEVPQVRRFVGASATGGGYPVGWYQAVADGVWGSGGGNATTTVHDLTVPGRHVLRVWVVEPGVVVQKIVVDFGGGGVRESYLGPPESFRAGVDVVGGYDGTSFAGVGVCDVV